MDISEVKRDAKSHEGGIWVKDIPQCGDLELLVRGLATPIAVQTRARKLRKVGRKERDESGAPLMAVEMRVMGETLAEVVLLDWRNFNTNGVPIPYSKETALKYCTDPNYTPFADAVTWAANSVDRGNREKVEDLSGNSQGPSDSGSEQTVDQ